MLPDLLKSIPGFSTMRKGGSNGDPVFRGMAGSRLGILVDGGQIAGGCPSRMDPPTAYIAPELFDRVVVIKGPETVLYGPGNSAGTVLFERDHARYAEPAWSLSGSVLGGSWGRNDQNIEIRGGTPTFYAGLVGNHTHSQDYDDGNGDRVHSSWNRWNVDTDVGWTPDDDTRVELTAGKGDGRTAYAFSSMDGAQFLRESAGLSFERRNLGEHFAKLEASAYYNYADHVMDNYTLRDPDPDSMMPMAMAADVDRRTVGGRVAGTFQWTGIELVAGMDASSNVHSARSGGPPGSMMGFYGDMPRERDARIATSGAFGELAWTFAERQRLVAGLRVDRARARGYALTTMMTGGMGDMGDGMDMPPETTVSATRDDTLTSGFVRWEHALPSSPVTLYAGIGHAERFPDYWELFGQHADTRLTAFLGLKPERTTQLDIGARYEGERLQAWVSAYVGIVDDFIVIDYGDSMGMGDMGDGGMGDMGDGGMGDMGDGGMGDMGDGGMGDMGDGGMGDMDDGGMGDMDDGGMGDMGDGGMQMDMASDTPKNVRARTRGGEAGASYAISERFKIDATIAYSWGENRSEHRPLPQIPPFEMRLAASYDTGTWSLGALLRGVSRQDRVAVGQGNIIGQDLGKSAGYGVLSFNGGYRFGNGLILTAGVDNVFDKVYAEHISPANPGFAGYVNTVRVNEPGRTAWAKLAFAF